MNLWFAFLITVLVFCAQGSAYAQDSGACRRNLDPFLERLRRDPALVLIEADLQKMETGLLNYIRRIQKEAPRGTTRIQGKELDSVIRYLRRINETLQEYRARGGGYLTKSLNSAYKDENLTENLRNGKRFVHYFDSKEREAHRIAVKSGDLTDMQGLIKSSTQLEAKEMNFAMDETGGFYGTMKGQFKEKAIHHSSYLGGAPISSAGVFSFYQGALVKISNASGHYSPSPLYILQAIHQLREQGVDLSKTTLFLNEFDLVRIEIPLKNLGF